MIPKPGEYWEVMTDRIQLYVQRVRIHAEPVDGWVNVQTERVSGKLGKVRRVRLSKFTNDSATGFYKVATR